jgi:hypothetical protein
VRKTTYGQPANSLEVKLRARMGGLSKGEHRRRLSSPWWRSRRPCRRPPPRRAAALSSGGRALGVIPAKATRGLVTSSSNRVAMSRPIDFPPSSTELQEEGSSSARGSLSEESAKCLSPDDGPRSSKPRIVRQHRVGRPARCFSRRERAAASPPKKRNRAAPCRPLRGPASAGFGRGSGLVAPACGAVPLLG